MRIVVTYKGYTAILYGRSSLSLMKDGKEVLHTCQRNINTAAEAYRFIDEYIEDLPELEKLFEDLKNGEDDEDI